MVSHRYDSSLTLLTSALEHFVLTVITFFILGLKKKKKIAAEKHSVL